MTEKNIFVYKIFCRLIFQILVYSLTENCNSTPSPRRKKSRPLSQQPHLKIEILSSPPLFKNLVGGSTPLPPAEKGGADYVKP